MIDQTTCPHSVWKNNGPDGEGKCVRCGVLEDTRRAPTIEQIMCETCSTQEWEYQWSGWDIKCPECGEQNWCQ